MKNTLVLSTTFEWDKIGKVPEHEYSRISNPNRGVLEKQLAEQDNGKFAFALSSGQAAIFFVFSFLKKGDHILCSADVYDGTIRTLKFLQRFGIEFSLIEPKNFSNLKKHIKPNTKMVFLENASSTLLNKFNIKNIKSQIGKDVFLVVDSTVSTPVFLKPLDNGADITVHSLTKFINGKNNSTGGAVITNNKKLAEFFKENHHTMGFPLAPFDCFLTSNNLKNLKPRMEKHTKNAKKVFDFLCKNKFIEKVNFPGFGSLISFTLKDISVNDFTSKLRKIKIAQSYGGPFTTIQHPDTMIDSSLTTEMKKKIGLENNLLRLHVGLENIGEIINDFPK